ncbi:MAG: rhomboid family intramembrane serine protease [Candidatus Hadarchaeota archaeon]
MFPIKDDNPTRKRPVVTWALIAINVGVFVGTLLSGTFDQTINDYGVRPARVLQGRELHALLTSMFLHGGILHILGNMIYLWIFGNNVEDVLGRCKFIIFYLATGLVATFSFVAVNPTSDIPLIGASGAISGILGAYILLWPRARVHTAVGFFYFWTLVAIPAAAVIGFWFVLQLLNMSIVWLVGAGAEIAYMAHIGGFVAGMMLILPLRAKLGKTRPRVTYTIRYHY